MFFSKKGGIQDIAIIIVVLFVTGIVVVVAKYAFSIYATEVTSNSQFNTSVQAVEATNAINNLTDRYDYIVFSLFMGMVLAMIIGGFLMGGNPIFMFIYFIVAVILTVVAIIFSYVWNRIATNATLSATVSELPITDFLISNIHILTPVVCFIGITVMFIRPFIGQQ